ncbi:uncharacterized protein, cytoplasmic domain of flagellar protein FhlB like protein [Halobacteroides halobius DSM 5150]|uniref:Uncharacterized protein, cytoplasmic domain of flagellar protein FhlB like protein n=1 Tax=Halobacteroides halobius (strain ATCC 35273 / DSM 5150 / MD-1) TaxID=748449 RepID=L0K942_HALHC|nr:EscU/YscU/HrcU family type III secretion system export apparatus switch protein [Halobacteroides halobius]AGB40864.1 uncharacterized protein, cytoplasmic domain of flagellar protein FhlB like protein [Halobacteroides halobius DSM 5150]
MENKDTKEAIALKYNITQDNAPKVIAKGTGNLAQEIIKTAQENDISIKEDDDLVKVLLQLKLGAEIPEELYEVVAEILSFVFEIEDLN